MRHGHFLGGPHGHHAHHGPFPHPHEGGPEQAFERPQRGSEGYRGPKGPFGGRGRWGWQGPEQGDEQGGGRWSMRAARGDVRSAILMLLSETPMHGYQIIQEIAQRSGDAWRPSPGSVYPALQMLQDEGLLAVQEAEGRRVFSLSQVGQAYVEKNRESIQSAWAAVTSNANDQSRDIRALGMQLALALKQVMFAGSPAQVASAREVLVQARRQIYRILAEDGDSTQA